MYPNMFKLISNKLPSLSIVLQGSGSYWVRPLEVEVLCHCPSMGNGESLFGKFLTMSHWVPISALPHISCVTLGNLHNLSLLLFSHQKNENDNSTS